MIIIINKLIFTISILHNYIHTTDEIYFFFRTSTIYIVIIFKNKMYKDKIIYKLFEVTIPVYYVYTTCHVFPFKNNP